MAKSRRYFILLVSFFVLGLSGCVTPTDVAYFQNADLTRGMMVQSRKPIRIQSGDKINITVNSADPLLMQQFNLVVRTNGVVPVGTIGADYHNNSSSQQLLAYTVDDQGDITFPELGKVSVRGKTRREIADYIQTRLYERNLVKDPIVTVEYVNLTVSVLGEVRNPGRVPITNDHITLLDAIAAAGDLTINGRRDNVMVLREVDGEDETYYIDLCDKEEVLTSPAYYLQQNDVVYVTPNDKRQREATVTGNTFAQPGFWFSLIGVIITISNFITK